MSFTIRPLAERDRERLLQILLAAHQWSDDEIAAAMAQIDRALRQGNDGEYRVYVAERSKDRETAVDGYACFGPVKKVDGTFDLYWIAVDPDSRRQGVGRALLKEVERQVATHGGHTLLIETSSKESFRPALQFYRANGYAEATRIKDFNRTLHDTIVFSRKLD